MRLEEEFNERAKMVKYDIMRSRMIRYFEDLLLIAFNPDKESAEEKYQRSIKNMTLEQLEKLAENAWQDELEKLNF